MNPHRAAQWLTWSVAFVWIWTAIGVLSPEYRAIGEAYLAPLGFKPWIMWATCAAELALAGIIVTRPPSTLWVALQTKIVAGFTLILVASAPELLVHPMGVLTKNLPLLAVLWASLELEDHGWTPHAERILRGGLGLIWFTEGLFPKWLFQSADEVAWVTQLFGSGVDAALLIHIAGAAQILAAFGVWTLRGAPHRALLWALAAGLVALPLLFSFVTPEAWFHPFGPFSKNIPILVGTIVLARRPSG